MQCVCVHAQQCVWLPVNCIKVRVCIRQVFDLKTKIRPTTQSLLSSSSSSVKDYPIAKMLPAWGHITAHVCRSHNNACMQFRVHIKMYFWVWLIFLLTMPPYAYVFWLLTREAKKKRRIAWSKEWEYTKKVIIMCVPASMFALYLDMKQLVHRAHTHTLNSLKYRSCFNLNMYLCNLKCMNMIIVLHSVCCSLHHNKKI